MAKNIDMSAYFIEWDIKPNIKMENEMDKNPPNEHGKRILHLIINGNKVEWHQQYITGAEIRKLGNIASEEEIFLAIKKPWEDEAILDDKEVNLARPEIEHFYSKAKHCDVTLIVNGRKRLWGESQINFEEVIVLAFGTYDHNPDRVYTVTYDRGPHQNSEGSMVQGDTKFVKDKMIFNATCTDKS